MTDLDLTLYADDLRLSMSERELRRDDKPLLISLVANCGSKSGKAFTRFSRVSEIYRGFSLITDGACVAAVAVEFARLDTY